MLRKSIILWFLIFSVHAYALVINTPIPRNYINDVIPQGYIACYTTKTGAYKGIWSGAHRICRYNIPGSEMWISGYWQCHRYQPRSGSCSSWKWILAHWENIKDTQIEPDVVARSGWHTK